MLFFVSRKLFFPAAPASPVASIFFALATAVALLLAAAPHVTHAQNVFVASFDGSAVGMVQQHTGTGTSLGAFVSNASGFSDRQAESPSKAPPLPSRTLSPSSLSA